MYVLLNILIIAVIVSYTVYTLFKFFKRSKAGQCGVVNRNVIAIPLLLKVFAIIELKILLK